MRDVIGLTGRRFLVLDWLRLTFVTESQLSTQGFDVEVPLMNGSGPTAKKWSNPCRMITIFLAIAIYPCNYQLAKVLPITIWANG